jgi:hypothetical protein
MEIVATKKRRIEPILFCKISVQISHILTLSALQRERMGNLSSAIEETERQ